jgi:transposase
MDQPWLLPPSLDELIPENHLVRVVNQVIDEMDISALLSIYKGGGNSSYHPKMMLKVIIYAYTQKIYSCRLIAKALRENIHFMWISASNRPNFRTINLFRLNLKDAISEIFFNVVYFLEKNNFIQLKNYFLDGTKVEANANKYTYVWKKSNDRYKDNLKKKVKELLNQIEEYNEQENRKYGNKDLEELGEDSFITSEMLEETVQAINKSLKENQESGKKKLSKAVKRIEKDYLPRLRKYEDYEKKLGNRNSFSKTDPDATFMRTKDDHMRNSQLKAAYNVQIGTENQYIVGFSLHQGAADTPFLIPHLASLKEKLNGKLPANVVADAGYGSEENYTYLAKEKLGNFVKFPDFHREQKKKYKENDFLVANLEYDNQRDEYICPAGKRLQFLKTVEKKTRTGYPRTQRLYQCENCTGCPKREMCHRSKYDRIIRISPQLNRFKNHVRRNLKSEQGEELRKKRGVEVESVFGQIKQNMGFRRFTLRGLEKVSLEWGLFSIAHNFKKMAGAIGV